MIDFVPIEYYEDIYIYLMLGMTLMVLMNSKSLVIHDPKNISSIKLAGFFILLFLIIYMGLRPISGRYFGDMITYAKHYRSYINGAGIKSDTDVLFYTFMRLCASIMGLHAFFMVCSVLYIYPMYRVSVAFFKDYWFYAFFMFVVSFSFWTYGTNGIRNGIACSVFLWGLSFKNNNVLHISLILLSTFVHQTLILPSFIYLITYFFNKPKFYFYFWVLCIPMSLALGSFWEMLFANLGFAEDRLSGYLLGESEEAFMKSGFRWDFLIYSSGAVAVGFYFILKRGFQDVFYQRIFSTYILTNAFWILVIRANFSNRFAYLSWFFMGLVIIYPFLTQRFFKNQHFVIAKVLLIYFSFTFFMSFVYYKYIRYANYKKTTVTFIDTSVNPYNTIKSAPTGSFNATKNEWFAIKNATNIVVY